MSAAPVGQSQVIEINVGGTIFTTLLSTLTKYPVSLLGAMFSGRHNLCRDAKNRVFIDRNPSHFAKILNFLRTGLFIWPEDNPSESFELKMELDYFGLSPYVCLPSKGNILVVEDEKVNASAVKHLLEKMGYSVLVCENGAEAIASYQSEQVDLIFMDCLMPVMDGIEATKTIRKLEAQKGLPRVPIISLTVLGYPKVEQECLAAGTDAHLIKPLRNGEIEVVLNKFMKIQQQQKRHCGN